MNTAAFHELFAAADPKADDGESSPGHKFFGGFFVKVQHPAGSTRTGIAPDGTGWATKMHNDYGELPGSKGPDGDPVDVYLGPYPDAKIVHVVHMNDADGNYDEDKAFLGFKGQQSVINAFRKHYPDGTAKIGAITSHRVAGFRKKMRLNKLANNRGEQAAKLHASDDQRADVAEIMEMRSFDLNGDDTGSTVVYQRGKNDRVVTIRFDKNNKVIDATLTYEDGYKRGTPVTREGMDGVNSFAGAQGD